LLPLFLLLGALSVAGADDWPMDGKTPSHAPVSADSIAPPLTLAWTFATAEPITAAPVVKDGVLYVGGYDGNFYALDALSGKEVWRYHPDSELFFWAPAAVAKGMVVFGGIDGIVYARDAKTGKNLWKFGAYGVIAGGITISGDRVYVSAMDNVLYALSLKSGVEQWRHTAQWYYLTAPAVDTEHGMLFTCAGDGQGCALATKDGHPIWRKPVSVLAGCPQNGPFCLAGDRLYLAVSPGHLRCLKAATGEVLWTAETGAGLSGCAVTDQQVIVGTRDGLSAFQLATGAPLWSFKDAAPVSRCTPAIAGKTVYFCSRNGRVYALDTTTGARRWDYATGGPIDGSPALANGRLYVTSCDGKVYSFQPK